MAWLETPRELRRAMRVRSKGSIRIQCGDRVMPCRMVDLAVGGICVRTELPIGFVAPALIDELVHIDLKLDATGAKHFALVGRMLRVSIPRGRMAIEFDEVPADFEDCVQDELLAAIEHDVLPRMILVDTAEGQRNKIASAFRNAGCHVTEAATPLEAIAYLGGARFELGLIAVADTVPETVAEQLREFLLDEHPGAHMVAIGRSALHRAAAESWLCSTNVRGDLQLRVGRVMTAHGSRRRSTTASCSSSPSRYRD